MEDVPRRKFRKKPRNRPSYLSKEVLDRVVAASEARLLEMVEQRRAEEALAHLLQDISEPPTLPEISVEKSIAISERGRAAILAAYAEYNTTAE